MMDSSGTPCCFAAPNLPLAVVVAHTQWDEPPRMRHHVTHQLMRWCNVLFVEFFATGARGNDKWTQHADRLIAYRPGLPFSVPVRLYANEPATHAFVNRCYTRKIGSAIAAQGAETVLLFNFSWNFPQLMDGCRFDRTAYVCCDEFPGMHSRGGHVLKSRYQRRLFQHYENQVARKVDVCLTPHYPLRDKFLKVNRNVHTLFHAHDYVGAPAIDRPPEDGRIHVGFAGYIHYRLLYEWLEAVAAAGDMQLHLIGPVNQHGIDALLAHGTVTHVPNLLGDALYRKLQEMHVLIVPLNPALQEVQVITTNSKTFQYVASGRPVVLSDLAHYIELPDGILYKARDAQDFIQKIRQAHAEDSGNLRNLRASIAAENTWKARGEQLRALMFDGVEDRLPPMDAFSGGRH